MRVTLKMPKVGDAADKVLVVELSAKLGDRVAEEAVQLMVVQTDKANVEVPSSLHGTVVAVVYLAVGDEIGGRTPASAIET